MSGDGESKDEVNIMKRVMGDKLLTTMKTMIIEDEDNHEDFVDDRVQ